MIFFTLNIGCSIDWTDEYKHLPATGARGAGWGAGGGKVGAACLGGGGECRAGGGGDVLSGTLGGRFAGGGACSLLGLVSLEVAALLQPVSCLKYLSFKIG